MADDDKKENNSGEEPNTETAGTDQPPAGPAGDAAPQQGGTDTPQAAVLAQYVKDLSFENPKAAQTLQTLSQGQVKPQIQININVGGTRLGEETYEVELKINATSKLGEETAFAVELIYAGLFGARNLPDTLLEPFLLVQAPHVLFPFARRVIADATRDGGFAPLMLEPIDFAALYQQQRQQAAQQGQTSTQTAAPEGSGASDLGTIDLGEPKGNA